MTILLGGLPRKTKYSLRPVRAASGVLSPSFGGPNLPLNRKGDRWAIDIDTGALDLECASRLMADLVRAGGETVCVDLPATGADIFLLEDPCVVGDGQAGSLLDVGGFMHGYFIRKGRLLSLIHDGRRYVHLTTDDVVADSDGLATLSIWPMLRVSPADNAVVELKVPRLEGFVHSPSGFSAEGFAALTVDQFSIEERA